MTSDYTVVDRELADELLKQRGPGSIVETMAKSAARAIGRQIVRGVLGSLLGGGSRRR